ncbi:hypothetical protein B0H19DRAFT_1274041 [Mycena capillaripes]|nr:hypothetical protein B0H19DRAFT_1274041 [Mycena capillaripes]
MFPSVFTISFLAILSSVVALGPAAVNLRTAGNFAILAKSGVSTVPRSVINGPVGCSPIAEVALTGFSLTLDSTGQFATSSEVVGKLFAASYTVPTPAILAVAIADMETADTDASAIGGLLLVPGLYKWSNAISIGSDIIIVGAPPTVISIAAGKKMVLVGGALAKNIVWVVSGAVTSGSGSHLAGVILAKTSITLQTGTRANNRLLFQTFVAPQQFSGHFFSFDFRPSDIPRREGHCHALNCALVFL